MPLTFLPTLNAILNSVAAVLLVIAWRFILKRNITAHRRTILTAAGVSGLFLISYVIYHAQVGSTPFTAQGWIRPVYFFILVTHVVLAIVNVPFVIITLTRGLKRQDERHRAIARITLPLWLYVSVTGVMVYGMLYHLT